MEAHKYYEWINRQSELWSRCSVVMKKKDREYVTIVKFKRTKLKKKLYLSFVPTE